MPDFTFEHEGTTHTLPPISESSRRAPGWAIQAALMNPDDYSAQVRLGVFALDASDASDEAKAALREMDGDAMLEVIGDWMGESVSSSQSSASTEEPSSTTAGPDSGSPSPTSE